MTRSESSKGSVVGSTSGSTDYAIPTTVGVANHDPTKHRAPSYSFGSRHETKAQPSPGPQYKVKGSLTARGSSIGPSFSMTARPRPIFAVSAETSGPGPNAYMVSPAANTFLNKKAPQYSFGLPYRSNVRSRHFPAPNSYSLPTTLGARVPHLRGGPASTLHGKGSDNKGFSYDHANTPGPAGYSAVDYRCTAERAPAFTLTGRPKVPPIKVITPGPGAYDHGNAGVLGKSSPRLSMGIRYGEKVCTLPDIVD